MSEEGYNIKKSRVADDKLAEFVIAPLVNDLKSVPGIGPAAEEKLKAVGIKNTYNLVGQFLIFKEEEQSPQALCDKMFTFIKDAGIVQYRSGIVTCVAEKADTMIPGLCSMDELREAAEGK